MIQEPNSPELESDEKSKSQIKREMEALQEMGIMPTPQIGAVWRQVPQ